MFDEKVLKLFGLGATLVGFGATLISNWTSDKLRDKTIKEEVNKAISEMMKTKGIES